MTSFPIKKIKINIQPLFKVIVILPLAISISPSALLCYILPLGRREHCRCVLQKAKLHFGQDCLVKLLPARFIPQTHLSLVLYLTHQFVGSKHYLARHWLGEQ